MWHPLTPSREPLRHNKSYSLSTFYKPSNEAEVNLTMLKMMPEANQIIYEDFIKCRKKTINALY